MQLIKNFSLVVTSRYLREARANWWHFKFRQNQTQLL